MKISFRILFISVCFIIYTSCAGDGSKNPIHGDWELIAWNVGIPFDLNNDVAPSLNLLDKTTCDVNETLTFDKNGTVTSDNTFSPEITISLKDSTSDVYFFKEICADGSIGFSTSYTQVNNQSVELNGATGTVESQKLTLVYTDAVKIYNEALTEVIDSKNLTLVYAKKK